MDKKLQTVCLTCLLTVTRFVDSEAIPVDSTGLLSPNTVSKHNSLLSNQYLALFSKMNETNVVEGGWQWRGAGPAG